MTSKESISDIEHPDMLRLIHWHEKILRELVFERSDLSKKERWEAIELVMLESGRRAVELGFWQSGDGMLDSRPFQQFKQLVQGIEDESVSADQAYSWWCDAGARRLMDAICRVRQQQLGEDVIGYAPSERLRDGIQAIKLYRLAKAAKIQRQKILREKLERYLRRLGYSSLPEFAEIIEAIYGNIDVATGD